MQSVMLITPILQIVAVCRLSQAIPFHKTDVAFRRSLAKCICYTHLFILKGLVFLFMCLPMCAALNSVCVGLGSTCFVSIHRPTSFPGSLHVHRHEVYISYGDKN